MVGWYGEFCHKVDTCFLKPCAPYAICSNTDDEEGRICYCNGGSGKPCLFDSSLFLGKVCMSYPWIRWAIHLGLECYQVQDPCDPSPCHNGGVCTRTGSHLEQFLCECKEFWYGPTCDQRQSACAWEKRTLANNNDSSTEVCLNGGVCQDNPIEFGYTCLCSSGWKGKRCEEPDVSRVVWSDFAPLSSENNAYWSLLHFSIQLSLWLQPWYRLFWSWWPFSFYLFGELDGEFTLSFYSCLIIASSFIYRLVLIGSICRAWHTTLLDHKFNLLTQHFLPTFASESDQIIL